MFGFDDDARTNRYYLFVDSSVECAGDVYNEYRRLAFVFMFIWCAFIPLLFLVVLRASRMQYTWAPALSQSLSFMHAEYRDELFYWEVISPPRPLTLSPFNLSLFTPSHLSPSRP